MLRLLDTESTPVPLSLTQGAAYRQVYDTYPTVRICANLIMQYVFERPMIGLDDTEQEEYRQLGQDMFAQAMTLGIAIVRAKPGTVPCIVPFEKCRVTVALDRGFRKVLSVFPARLADGDQDVHLPHVYVLDVFGFSPSLRGELNSLMRPLVFKIELVRDQMDCAIAADRARARPACFTETHDGATAPAQEVTYDFYADANSVQNTSMNTYMRNQGALDQLEAQQQNLRAGGDRAEGGLRERVASHNINTAVKNAIDSITPLPIGQQVARGPECHAPDQLVERMRFIEQEIFVLLGVPRSFCMHDITVRHDAGMLHCTMTRTVHMWQRAIGTALSFVYNVIHNGPPAKRRRRVADVAKAARARDTELRFERMPRVSVEELSYAYDKGILKWEAYKRHMATFCGMDADDLTEGAEPFSKDERLVMMTGKASTSDKTWKGSTHDTTQSSS
jgi:hypothetical protein|tara:strand:+ start:481 stop:1824 length:1344 start_codon:yes stop_codon:yes gene_type:complete